MHAQWWAESTRLDRPCANPSASANPSANPGPAPRHKRRRPRGAHWIQHGKCRIQRATAPTARTARAFIFAGFLAGIASAEIALAILVMAR